MVKRLLLLSIPLALMFAGGDAGASSSNASGIEGNRDWPQWRGPGRNALSPETDLVDRWGDAGPKVLWRIKAGEGYSSVSVSDGRLYTLWDEQGGQLLVCLDALTGKRLWSRELGPAFENHYGNGPRSTPLVEDGVVYAVGTNGFLLAANQRTGETLWARDLVQDFEADLPSYGYSSSPLVVEGKLALEVGGARAAYVALQKKTGKVAWIVEHDQPAYSSPIGINIDGVSQVVFWSAHGLHSVASADGTLLWRYPWETFCPVSGDPLNTGTPIFHAPDRVFFSSGSGAAMIRIVRKEGSFETREVWQSEEMRSDVNTPLLLDGHIYGFDRGTLKSLHADNGKAKWQARGFQRGSIIAADDKLIVLGENGKLALLDANPDAYVERSSAAVLRGRNWTSPSLAAGRLYLRNNEEIVCLDMNKQ